MKRRNNDFDIESLNSKLDRRGYLLTADESYYTDNYSHYINKDIYIQDGGVYYLYNNGSYQRNKQRRGRPE